MEYFFKYSFFFLYMCLSALPASMFKHHIYSWCPQRPEEGARSPGTGLTGGCEPPCGCWESNLCPCKSSQSSQPLSHLSIPLKGIFSLLTFTIITDIATGNTSLRLYLFGNVFTSVVSDGQFCCVLSPW